MVWYGSRKLGLNVFEGFGLPATTMDICHFSGRASGCWLSSLGSLLRKIGSGFSALGFRPQGVGLQNVWG